MSKARANNCWESGIGESSIWSDKILSVPRILLLALESSLEFFLLWRGDDSVRAERSANVPRSDPVTSGSIHVHFIFLFEVSTYLLPVLHQEDAKSISKSTFDSPSSLGKVHWGIYLHYEKKQGPEYKRPFYVCSVAAVETSGISIVVEYCGQLQTSVCTTLTD